jgi:DNA-binding CsgD family transcriptional regulator
MYLQLDSHNVLGVAAASFLRSVPPSPGREKECAMLTTLAKPSLDIPPPRVRRALRLVGKMTRCSSTGPLTEILLEALQPFGISTYAIWAAVNPERVDPLASMLSNWSDEWARVYMSERKYLYDPVVQEAVKRPGNFFWRDISIPDNSPGSDLFRQARQYGMIDGFTMSARAEWPVVTALSVSGLALEWDELEEGAVSMIAHTFMSRTMYLRAERVIPAVKALSDQERRVLHSAAEGASDKTIARGFGVQPGTIVTHWERIREKLGARDRAQSVAIALWSGQITV